MPREKNNNSAPRVKFLTRDQTSAGGVAFRTREKAVTEVALISVRPSGRWQLPKGLVEEGELPEEAAVREVREEAGIETDLLCPLETVEYWYVAQRGGQKVRYHKFVHFFLLAYRGGDVSEHDHEVEEARWVEIDAAAGMLAFKSERAVVEKARAIIAELKNES